MLTDTPFVPLTAAKKFGCTDFVNPNDYDKPVQQVSFCKPFGFNYLGNSLSCIAAEGKSVVNFLSLACSFFISKRHSCTWILFQRRLFGNRVKFLNVTSSSSCKCRYQAQGESKKFRQKDHLAARGPVVPRKERLN